MNETLKTLEKLLHLVHTELNRVSCDDQISDETYRLVHDASIEALNLRTKIEEARAWNSRSKL